MSEDTAMRFSALAGRVAPAGIDPWVLHWQARHAHAAGEDVLVLSAGDPDLDTPAPVVDKAVERLRARDTHYTETAGRPLLRAAIARSHAARTGQAVTAENVIFLGGAQNGLFVASLLLAGPGDEIIAIDPMYVTYPATIQASGATLVPAPAPAAANFHPDLAALEAAVTPRTRAIFLATPNNPTGIVLGDREVRQLADLARRRGLWIVSDEVYAGLAERGRVPSLGACLPEQVLTVSSLSKTHAMTGWRAGWVIGPTAFVQAANDVAACMLYGLPGFVQEAAITALEIAPESERGMREYCQRRRNLMHAGLAGIEGLRPYLPDAGMFMLVDIRGLGLSSAQFVRGLYDAERVSVLDGSVFGRTTEGFVRLCFAMEEHDINEACARIRRFCVKR
ncbi:MAG TPA: aminotransferase class I/II-fold pyridoxal phosphate-dependent enzyme [Steroidobacteraceae bacterium]|nr:aminotransferase class I/II-fold pyridoxal phosphate-dependent enzyme [Steroidobacteraceae bacterium]